MGKLLKRYRVIFTTVREQYQYEVSMTSKTEAVEVAREWALADGWNGMGTIETERI